MPESKIEINGITFRVRIDGPEGAPYLLLINSLSTTLEMWDDQIPNLAGHFRVIRYDQRGHGGTSTPSGPYSIDDLGQDALALLDRLSVTSASLCGVSLGGMVSLWLGINAPEVVDKIVAACTSANFAPKEFWTQRAESVLANGVDSLYEGLLGRWFTPYIDERNPKARSLLRTMLSSCTKEGYAEVCGALGNADIRNDLGKITVPTLFIAGAFDPATPPAVAAELFELVPNSALRVIPNASHLANLEQPELFIDAVLEHLIGSPKSRGMMVRTQVLGAEHVAKATSTKTEFTAPFQDFISRYAWGEIWTRPGLDRKSRSIVTLTTLVALGHLNEFSFHVPAALRNGLSKEEILEVLMQCAIYAGVPAANSAIAKANEILQNLDDSNLDGRR